VGCLILLRCLILWELGAYRWDSIYLCGFRLQRRRVVHPSSRSLTTAVASSVTAPSPLEERWYLGPRAILLLSPTREQRLHRLGWSPRRRSLWPGKAPLPIIRGFYLLYILGLLIVLGLGIWSWPRAVKSSIFFIKNPQSVFTFYRASQICCTGHNFLIVKSSFIRSLVRYFHGLSH
jgi:hypothetical protein